MSKEKDTIHSLDMSYASIISNENSQILSKPPSLNNSLYLEKPPKNNTNQKPSSWAFIKGHGQYFLKSTVQFIFKDNNLPLLINLVYHLIAARALLAQPWKTVTRYLSIPPTPQQSSSLKFQIDQTTSIAMDAFKSQGVFHLALAALAGLALKERRQSSERSALFVLTLSSLGQSWVHLNGYWKSSQHYTLKAFQEICSSDVLISFICSIALTKTVKRTGKLI